jgi:hypothetical protein
VKKIRCYFIDRSISFGGDEEIISSLELINPEKIVSYAEGS